MMRKLASVAAAAALISAMGADYVGVRGITHMPSPKRRPLWTCKKCGDKFRPHMSNAMCDNCIRARDGESV